MSEETKNDNGTREKERKMCIKRVVSACVVEVTGMYSLVRQESIIIIFPSTSQTYTHTHTQTEKHSSRSLAGYFGIFI